MTQFVEDASAYLVLSEALAELVQYECLDGLRGKSAAFASSCTELVPGLAAIVAVGALGLPRGRGDVGLAAAPAAQEAAEQVGRVAPPRGRALGAVAVQDPTGPIEHVDIDDRLVFARESLIPQRDETGEDGVSEHPGHSGHAPERRVLGLRVLPLAGLRAVPGRVQLVDDLQRRLEGQIALEDEAHDPGLGLVDHQLVVAYVVANGYGATGPLPAATRSRHLVAGALGDHLSFELGEAHEHVQGQPAHGVRGREALGHGHELHVGPGQPVHELREVEE